jgi:hypothetical protein
MGEIGLLVGMIGCGFLRLAIPLGVHVFVEAVCERVVDVIIDTSLNLVLGRRPEFTHVFATMVVI